jgi:hypothetical protein
MLWQMIWLVFIASASPALAGASASPLALPAKDLGTAATVLPNSPSLTCRDFKGRTVRLIEVPDLGDAGRAEVINATPVIMLDPKLLATLPANLQVFFSLHECAHHVLGHLYAPTNDSEKQADCWAVKMGRDNRVFARGDIDSWNPFFAASRGSKMGHLPGPERVSFLAACFDEPTAEGDRAGRK